ncbi:hypothetical protein F2Q69_00046286, partial [Brassica cretica]
FLESSRAINIPPLGAKEALFPWILWGIWTAKNYLIFENGVFDPSDIFSKAVANARDWNEAQRSPPTPSTVQSYRLLPSPANIFALQCFTDAAWNAAMNKAGCSWYMVNCENDVILQGTPFLESTRAINLPPLGAKETLFPWILWGIWTARNYLIFENRVFDPSDIFSKAVANARDWNEAQRSPPTPPTVQSYRLPPPLRIPLHFNASPLQLGTRR